MHGVRRREKTSEEIERDRRKKELEKVELFQKLSTQVFSNRNAEVYDSTALDLTSKLLSMNGEIYSVWNYRRKILAHLLKTFKEQQNGEALKKLVLEELKFIQGAIAMNPKSYWAFNQRVWLTLQAETNWEKELGLCDHLLKLDERNFHCWDYRRFCAKHNGSSIQDEFNFTTKKVEDNFSNYSAWHQRSVLLPILYQDDPQGLQEALIEEFELVKNAFYTEPKDQSAWFYHRWLRYQTCGTKASRNHQQEKILKTELQALRELQHEEPDAKWVILTLTEILQELGSPDDQSEIKQNLDRLIKIDPDHKHYYVYLSKK